MKRPSVEMLVSAYVQGIFPMAHSDQDDEIFWYAPDPRAILPLDACHFGRRLRQEVRRGTFEVRFSTAFRQVMEACAAPRPDHPTSWISPDLLEAYVELHDIGLAHSVECWREGQLVGGLYGVAIGGLFAGESMFHRETNASKVALYHLVEQMKQRGMTLLDTQFITPHLAQFGAIEIPRDEYLERLEEALKIKTRFI